MGQRGRPWGSGGLSWTSPLLEKTGTESHRPCAQRGRAAPLQPVSRGKKRCGSIAPTRLFSCMESRSFKNLKISTCSFCPLYCPHTTSN